MGFPLEPLKSLFIPGERVRKKLERHIPAELRVPSPVDLAHPTLSEQGNDLEVSETGPSGDRHGWPSTRVEKSYHQREGFERLGPLTRLANVPENVPGGDGSRDGGAVTAGDDDYRQVLELQAVVKRVAKAMGPVEEGKGDDGEKI